jgi:hypothetical protein
VLGCCQVQFHFQLKNNQHRLFFDLGGPLDESVVMPPDAKNLTAEEIADWRAQLNSSYAIERVRLEKRNQYLRTVLPNYAISVVSLLLIIILTVIVDALSLFRRKGLERK